MEHVRSCTGDVMAGLAPADLVELSLAMPGGGIPAHLDALLTKIHRAFPALFDPDTGTPITPSPKGTGDNGPDPPRQEGDTADAGREHEDDLARQATAAARLDLLVIAAVRGAHRKADSSAGTLEKLQREIDDAVRRRTDLDTPAGARDFQRFLIGKLGEIESVLHQANLDEASYRALMTAWKSLYAAGRDPTEQPPANPGDNTPTAPQPAPAPPAAAQPDLLAPADLPDYPDDYPGAYGALPPAAPAPPQAPPPTAPAAPAAPLPILGAPPGFGASPSAGLPLADLLSAAGTDHRSRHTDHDPEDDLLDDALPMPDEPDATPEEPDADPPDDATADPAPAGPTTVTLPTGDTVTAANPQLAAVITEAAAGTPIAEAFQHHGIAIPPPGTAVPEPLDPARLEPGDIGMFTDRHALALGNAKAIFNGQIQQSTSVAGPSFLGWEHPPGPGATPTVPPPADAPTPTRPATTGG